MFHISLIRRIERCTLCIKYIYTNSHNRENKELTLKANNPSLLKFMILWFIWITIRDQTIEWLIVSYNISLKN